MSMPIVTVSTPSTGSGAEFRVVVRGLKLDNNMRNLLDASIRSAVMQQLALLDLPGTPTITDPANDPRTRSLFGGIKEGIRGFTATQQ